MRFSRISLVIFVWSSLPVSFAQQQAPPAAAQVDEAFIQSEFGSHCSLVGLPPQIGDLDGDGVEDIVIPARCTSPMMDAGDHDYYVIDPYYAFFGYGNPKITTAFVTEDPQRRGYSLLIIHGSGPNAWRSATPKAKFLVVNLPFRQVSVKRLAIKKRMHMAIFVEEDEGDPILSAIYWDGSKYRYQPMGSSLE